MPEPTPVDPIASSTFLAPSSVVAPEVCQTPTTPGRAVSDPSHCNWLWSNRVLRIIGTSSDGLKISAIAVPSLGPTCAMYSTA